MSKSSKNIEITRVETSLGTFIVVSHDTGVRAGLVVSQPMSHGEGGWYAQCADWYGAGIAPIECRVPEKGGYASQDELEQAIIEELSSGMKTDYWSDR